MRMHVTICFAALALCHCSVGEAPKTPHAPVTHPGQRQSAAQESPSAGEQCAAMLGEWNPNHLNQCTCPSGTTFVASQGKCLAPTIAQAGETSVEAQNCALTRRGVLVDGVCACANGQQEDEDGVCVADDGSSMQGATPVNDANANSPTPATQCAANGAQMNGNACLCSSLQSVGKQLLCQAAMIAIGIAIK